MEYSERIPYKCEPHSGENGVAHSANGGIETRVIANDAVSEMHGSAPPKLVIALLHIAGKRHPGPTPPIPKIKKNSQTVEAQKDEVDVRVVSRSAQERG
jgi:hypothetical protein